MKNPPLAGGFFYACSECIRFGKRHREALQGRSLRAYPGPGRFKLRIGSLAPADVTPIRLRFGLEGRSATWQPMTKSG